MLNIGEHIRSDQSHTVYTVTWASETVTLAEVGFAATPDAGEAYFIKRLLNPKYPLDSSPGTPRAKEARRKECDKYFAEHKALFESIAKACGTEGACVPIIDFFRDGASYYTVYRKIDATSLTLEQIARMPLENKLRLLHRLVQGLQPLHTQGVVHSDLKPDNILVQEKDGDYRIRLIDMNDCYRAGQPNPPDAVVGTLEYYSPELYEYNTCEVDYDDEEDVARVERMAQGLTPKSDIFALGIIFCQYFTGERPYSTDDKVKDLCHAAMEGKIALPATVDGCIRPLLTEMLDASPDRRPTLLQIGKRLQDTILGMKRVLPPTGTIDAPSRDRKTLTLTSPSPGCDIYYTTDGSHPTEHSQKYTGPIDVTKTTTFKAISVSTATKKASEPRDFLVSLYVFTGMKVLSATPRIKVEGKTVTITPATAGAACFYTLDGSRPSKASTPYEGPFSVDPETTSIVRAIALEPEANKLPSQVAETHVYKARLQKPVIHYKFGNVSMESPDGADIYYTEDGSTPTTASTRYTGPFTLANTERFIITAACLAEGCTASETSVIKRPSGIVMT